MIATTFPSLYACSFVSLLQVQTKFFLAVNVFPSCSIRSSPSGIWQIMAFIIGGPAVFDPGGAVGYIHRARILAFADEHGLPAAYGFQQAVREGGLMSYGVNLTGLWRQIAELVDKLLKGAKPADLPIEQPTKFELIINLKTAKLLGLEIPPVILATADEVIE
jgi:ABC transporter substrate binding protein